MTSHPGERKHAETSEDQRHPRARVLHDDLDAGLDFVTIVFPRTGAFRPLAPAEIDAIARPLFTKPGGLL